MNTCAIILARAGSKGIPRKNMQLIGGETLIARCVRTALSAKTIGSVCVSTDDSLIAEDAVRAGAFAETRPTAFASDTASSEAALTQVLGVFAGVDDEYERPTQQAFAFLQCTSPLMTADDIDRCMRLVLDGEADSAFCAAPFHGYVWGPDAQPEGQRKRRQDERPRLLEAGSCYAIRTERFLAECTRFCGRVRMVEIPAERCLEIDTPADLERARAIIERGER